MQNDDQFSARTVGLCAGKGKYYSLSDPADYPEQLSYPTTRWLDIVQMAASPACEPKEAGWWVIPSELNSRRGRLSLAQEEDGRFWLMVADLDKGSLDLAAVVDRVQALLDPGVEFLIYATKSSRPANPTLGLPADHRWRIMVPLEQSVPGFYYHGLASVFNEALAQALSVEIDGCTNRVNQVAFLPNRGAYYEWHHQPGVPCGATDDQTLATHLVQAAITRTRSGPAGRSLARRQERGFYLEEFAKRHPVEELLERYGFVNRPGSQDWHHPRQTSSSYATKETEDGRWVTSSETVAHALGRRGGDSFDLYCAFECDGDRDRAYRNICAYITTGSAEPPVICWGEYITCGGTKVRMGVVQ